MSQLNTSKAERHLGLASACFSALAVLMGLCVFATIYLAIAQLSSIGLILPYRSVLALAATAMVLVVMSSIVIASRAFNAISFPTGNWLIHLFVIGIALRMLVWYLGQPNAPVSDGAAYLQLARLIADGEPYFLNGHAFWPPGTPFVYTGFMTLLGDSDLLPLLVNLAFFSVSCFAVKQLAQLIDSTGNVGHIALLVLAVWPELVFTAGHVSKETVLLGLLPLSYYLFLSSKPSANLAAGLVGGLVVLTQPSLLILPILFGFSVVCSGHAPRGLIARLGGLILGMCIVVAPWTYRNYLVFQELVPVSTNAGLVLHAGNQARMVRPVEQVGGFLQPAEPAGGFVNDLDASRWHKEQAFKFIQQHPDDFAFLVGNRLTLTFGDDSDSAYRAFRLTDLVENKTYLALKAVSNGFWLALVAILAALCWKARHTCLPKQVLPLSLLTVVVLLSLAAIHGLAEGAARHHMAWSWLLALHVGILKELLSSRQQAFLHLKNEDERRIMSTTT